ncbi:MAG: hypothetical protein GC202_11870 [Alphaproteobacteria bacterium]|nr:hypothetical protein [Alphaproteobacteria bacterium]
MLRKRIVALLPVRRGIVIQSFCFARYLPVGRLEIAIEFLDEWGVDEIVVVDIDATRENRTIDPALVERASGAARVPLAVGGGVRSVEDAHRLLASGADKIVLRSTAAARPGLVGEIATFFGDQCVVVAMDLHRAGAAPPAVRQTPGSTMPGDPLEAMAMMAGAGAGEILAQVTDDDGRGGGIDVSYLREGAALPALPLIVASGTGHPGHVAAALRVPGVAAVAIANILSHSEQSVTTLKSWLRSNGVDVRLDTAHDYLGGDFDSRGRPLPPRPVGGR